MKTKSPFSPFSELLPKNKDDRFLYWIGIHTCEILVIETFEQDDFLLQKETQLSGCLNATQETTMLEFAGLSLDIERDQEIQKYFAFRICETD